MVLEGWQVEEALRRAVAASFGWWKPGCGALPCDVAGRSRPLPSWGLSRLLVSAAAETKPPRVLREAVPGPGRKSRPRCRGQQRRRA